MADLAGRAKTTPSQRSRQSVANPWNVNEPSSNLGGEQEELLAATGVSTIA